MYFSQDTEHGFYYMGVEEPHARLYAKYFKDSIPYMVALDVESISIKERIALGIGVAVSPDIAFYFVLFPTESPATPWHVLRNDVIIKILHNCLFDYSCLREFEVSAENVRDTSVMSRLLLYKYNGLADLTHIHGKPLGDIVDLMKEHKARTMLDVPQAEVAKKCMQDCMATFTLHNALLPQTDMAYYDVEMQTIPIMVKMSYRGLKLDQDTRGVIEDLLEDDVAKLLQTCEELEGFNPGSPQQVSYVLAKRGAYSVFSKLPFTKNIYGRRTNSLSTNVKVLEAMTDPIASLVLDYRGKNKLLGTYIRPWANEERGYTRYHLDAITGRPSSTDRNMQNIPGKYKKDGTLYPYNCRGVLLPDTEVWTDLDLSQVEPRALAYLSQDREMMHIFSLPPRLPDGERNPDADIHGQVAEFMGITRKLGKTVNLAMTYGATDETLMETAGIKDKRRASQLREMWFQKFPQAGDYIKTCQEEAVRYGVATTAFGRKMRLPTLEEESIDGIQRKSVDYPCQGTAADILKRGLIVCKDMDIALQVHDELLIDSYVPEYKFKRLESVAPFWTPFEVKYLNRWE